MSYDVSIIKVGHLVKEEVNAISMPRQEFLRIVANLLARPEYQGIRDKILPIAETMPRFPLRAWVDSARGCGCVVGEYLIAAQIMERASLAAFLSDEGWTANLRIHDELQRADPVNAEALFQFGSDIDNCLRARVEDGLNYAYAMSTFEGRDNVIVFVDK